jgi:hypothetical protein
MLDPEELGPQGMKCPKCGADLSMSDLFGQSATLAEDDLPVLGLDDLVGSVAQPGASYKPPQPPPRKPAKPEPPAPRVRSVGLNAPAPKAATGMVHVPRQEEDAEERKANSGPPKRVPGQTSAADLMRALKKKK